MKIRIEKDLSWLGWAFAVLLALAIGLYAGYRIMRAISDLETIKLQGELDATQDELVDIKAELKQNQATIVTWDTIASFYTEASSGKTQANGKRFDEKALTAAHRSLKFGTILIVENLENGKLSPIQIQDRGPYIAGRGLDVSKAVAERLGIVAAGLATVRVYELRKEE